MNDYTKAINFEAKDALAVGDPNKKAKGTEVDDEFDAIAVAIATKMDKSGGTFTGPITIDGANPIVLEGATGDAFETTFSVTDPTADRTITIPDLDITLFGDPMTTRGDFVYRDASNDTARFAVGGSGTFVRSDGTDPSWSALTLSDLPIGAVPSLQSEVATTSGTSVTLASSIPSWVTEVTINVTGMSTSGSSIPIIQIGDSGGFETTGYNGSTGHDGGAANMSTGFSLTDTNVAAATVLHGVMVLTLQNAGDNTWCCNSNMGKSDSAVFQVGGGSKALSGVLTQIQITTVGGTDTFDAGAISVTYK